MRASSLAVCHHQDGKSKLFYGIVLSAYCAGQIIGSVSLGAAAPRWGFRATLFASLAVECLGYVAYSLTANAYVILVSRLVAGIGAGTSRAHCGVTPLYGAQQSCLALQATSPSRVLSSPSMWTQATELVGLPLSRPRRHSAL